MTDVNAKQSMITNPDLGVTITASDTTAKLSKTNKKANKALLSELESLMNILTQTQGSSKKMSTSKSSKLLSDLGKIAEGDDSSSDNSDLLESLRAYISEDSGNLTNLFNVIQKATKGSDGQKDGKVYLARAEKLMNELKGAITSGETSLDEVLNHKNMKAFVEALGSEAPASSKKDTSNTKTSSKDAEYKSAMLNMAVDLQSLLTNIYKAQTDQGATYNEVLKAQNTSIQTNTAKKVKDMQDDATAQATAGKKPWYMYLIAAVVAVAGAVLAFFTCGAAAAATGLVIAAIMMSPIGDDLTSAITKAIAGPNPTDAQSLGASVAATAIITLITTLLSMGGSSLTSVGEGVADGVADGVSAAGTAATTATEEGVEEGLEEGVEEGINGGGRAVEEAAQEQAENLEEMVEGEIEDATGDDSGGDNTSSTNKGSSKVGSYFKNLKFDKGAFTTGLFKRFVGEYIQGFLGSGGLSETAQAVAMAIPGGKDALSTSTGAIILAVSSAIISMVGSYGVNKGLTLEGVGERSDYLEANNLTDPTVELTKGWSIALNVVRGAGNVANGGAQISKYFEYKKASDIENDLASMEGLTSVQTSNMQSLNTMQTTMNKSYSKEEDNINSSLQQAISAFGAEGRTLAQGLSG